MKTYTLLVYGEDMYDKPYRRKIKVKAKSLAQAIKIMEEKNGVIEVYGYNEGDSFGGVF